MSSRAQVLAPLVNVPTFNDLDNQQFTDENSKVFMRYQTVSQKRSETLNIIAGERQMKQEGSKTLSTYRTTSQNSSEVQQVRSG